MFDCCPQGYGSDIKSISEQQKKKELCWRFWRAAKQSQYAVAIRVHPPSSLSPCGPRPSPSQSSVDTEWQLGQEHVTHGIAFEGYAREYKISPNQTHSRKLNSLGIGESTMWEISENFGLFIKRERSGVKPRQSGRSSLNFWMVSTTIEKFEVSTYIFVIYFI